MNNQLSGLLKTTRLVVLAAAFFVAPACQNKSTKKENTAHSGVIHISVDESFKPVIDSQIKVFESSYPDAKIIAHYKPEAECLKDLNYDSIRLVIVTRKLTDKEAKAIESSSKIAPSWNSVAMDAIAVVVNTAAKDTLFDMADIRSMVKGTSGYKYKVVLDGLSATSTVRYAVDSLAGGARLGANVVAAKNSQGVLDYISANTDAIGLVGVSWIGNKEDSVQSSFLQKVKIASIECSTCQPIVYTQPFQYNIATRRYPMLRRLYYILKENYNGLGSGFADFLIYERGQLIFKRSYLWPAKMKLDTRAAKLEE